MELGCIRRWIGASETKIIDRINKLEEKFDILTVPADEINDDIPGTEE